MYFAAFTIRSHLAVEALHSASRHEIVPPHDLDEIVPPHELLRPCAARRNLRDPALALALACVESIAVVVPPSPSPESEVELA